MWTSFRLNGRDLEWCVTDGPSRRLLIRSRAGDFSVQSMILDNALGKVGGESPRSVVGPPMILGTEFPLGCRAPEPPIAFKEVFEIAEYGIIHTEFVRSLIDRWTHRGRFNIKAGKEGTLLSD